MYDSSSTATTNTKHGKPFHMNGGVNEEAFSSGTPGGSDTSHQYRAPGITSASDDASEAYISRTLYICKLPPDFPASQINEILSGFGDIKRITCYPSRQIAFAEFWDLRDAQKARNGLKDIQIGGHQVDIQYSKTRDDRVKEKNTGTLYVRPITTERNFRDPNTLQQYKELFNRFGEVKKVNTNRKREAEKFIEYHDLRSAEAALEGLNGMDFNGVKLEVQYANQSSKTINKESFVVDGAPSLTLTPTPYNSKPNSFRKEVPLPHPNIRPKLINNDAYDANFQEPRRQACYWTGLPINLHWNGSCGPRAMLSSMNPCNVNIKNQQPAGDFLPHHANNCDGVNYTMFHHPHSNKFPETGLENNHHHQKQTLSVSPLVHEQNCYSFNNKQATTPQAESWADA